MKRAVKTPWALLLLLAAVAGGVGLLVTLSADPRPRSMGDEDGASILATETLLERDTSSATRTSGPLAKPAAPQIQRRRGFRGYGRKPPYSLPLMIDGMVSEPGPLHRPNGAPYEFYFTRAAYSGYGYRGFASWSVDYPKADRQFLIGLERLLGHIDAYAYENPILLNDPSLSRYPFLYAVEVGYMSLSPEEVDGLRRYLQRGGFLMVDDFWGSREWANMEQELARVLPDNPIVDLDLDHPIFHCFYDIEKLVQVPNVGLGRAGGRTHEQDGFVPMVRGILDDHGRLMVVINWNCDLGDAWEWAEDPYYPLEFSTYAYQVGVNFIVYAMTH